MNLDLQKVDRHVYSMLDMLGDIGGLAGSLHAFAAASIGLIMYQSVNSYLSDSLYSFKRYKKENEPKVKPMDSS